MRSTLWATAAAALALAAARPAAAYVEAPLSLGAVVNQSTCVMVLVVEKVDRERNLIVYRKVRDVKGTHPAARAPASAQTTCPSSMMASRPYSHSRLPSMLV